MSRVDKPLIKDDLIATICALTPDKHPTPQDLKQLTVRQLTLMLRLIIYDPDRYNITQTVAPLQIEAKLCNDDVIYIHDAEAV